MARRVTWETLEGEGGALIVGTTSDGDSVCYVVDAAGGVDCDESQTDGDFGGSGWPEPPRRYIREATALARAIASSHV